MGQTKNKTLKTSSIEQIENKHTKRLRATIEGTGVAVAYHVTCETTVSEEGEQEQVKTVFGTIARGDERLGFVSYDRDGERMNISFEPFSATTAQERQEIVAAVVANVEEITA